MSFAYLKSLAVTCSCLLAFTVGAQTVSPPTLIGRIASMIERETTFKLYEEAATEPQGDIYLFDAEWQARNAGETQYSVQLDFAPELPAYRLGVAGAPATVSVIKDGMKIGQATTYGPGPDRRDYGFAVMNDHVHVAGLSAGKTHGLQLDVVFHEKPGKLYFAWIKDNGEIGRDLGKGATVSEQAYPFRWKEKGQGWRSPSFP
ncbi:MAG: hypothetical protein AAFN92_21390, partial [Bacteroidota bacterium]